MNLGQFLSGAGVISEGIRQTEEAERVARENQLAIEEQNRFAAFKAKMAQDAARQKPQVLAPQFLQNISPILFNQSQQFPDAPVNEGLGVRRMSPAEVARLRQDPYAMGAAPTAPAAPVPGQMPLPAGVQPSQAGAGRGVVNPPLVGQPQPQLPSPPYQDISGFTPPVGMTGPQNLAALREARMQRFAALAAPATATRAVPAVAPRTVPAVAPNKAAQKYDDKTTPYDALIAQSAQQYGVDPVVFKRLIGTESSFSPTAVSPRGEKFGLGIAQIADVHPLTREQRLDPNTAIPFAAQLFAQYLQEAGGNYEQAIQKYKGASSAGGKAAMAGPIKTILSGVTPSLGAAPTAAAAPTLLEVPKSQARNMEMAESYLANPQSIPYEYQQLMQAYQQVATQAQEQANLITQQRNETARLAQMYMQSGTTTGIDTAMRMRDVVNNYDNELLKLKQGVSNEQLKVTQKQLYLQGMQGLRELAIANDPRRLAGVLSQTLGVPVGIQPRSDRLYNYFVNGKRTREGISPGQLAEMALKDISPEVRQAAAASAALENELALKLKYDPQRDATMYKAAAELQKAIIDGEFKLAEKRAEQLGGKLTVDTVSGLAYFTRGREVFVINPQDTKEEIGGQTITFGPRARPIGGLNTGR